MFDFIYGTNIILSIVSITAAIFCVEIARSAIFSKGLKYSFRVAVIGLPRSGKTTLITVVFDKILSGVTASHFTVNGSETVNKITNNISVISNGLHLKPTNNDNVFAYRYTYKDRFLFINRRYDVEIADFPGEYSENIGNKNQDENESSNKVNLSLFNKEFFSWILSADRYIFTIDVDQYQKNGNQYVKDMEVLTKNTVWLLKQELLDENISDKKVALVFTKCDVLYGDNLSKLHGKDIKYKDVSFTNYVVNEDGILDIGNGAVRDMENEFDSVILFLKNNFKNCSTVFHSSYNEVGILNGSTEKIMEFTTP